MQPAKSILVVRATDAQGRGVVDALLAPTEVGEPSPYSVGALTKDTSSDRSWRKAIEHVQGISYWSLIENDHHTKPSKIL